MNRRNCRLERLATLGVCGLLGLMITQLELLAQNPTTLTIGASAPDFDLPGVDGSNHRLAEYASAKVLVIVFTCNHCPTAQAYEERIIRLHSDYVGRGVALVAISPNDPLAVRLDELGYTDLGDSLEDMKLRAKAANFQFPYLFDGQTQAVSRAYGAKVTPHVFVFDAARRLRYQGRIDDSDIKHPNTHDARNAIDAVLADREVKVPETRVFGCSVKWSDKKGTADESVKKWNQELVELTEVNANQLSEIAKNRTEKFRLVNVWATWCGPCLQELPQLVEIHRMYRKRHFEIITLSLDEVDMKQRVRQVLQETHMSTRNHLSTIESKDELAEILDSKWTGPLPYTLLIAPGGKVVYRCEGAFDSLELKRVIVQHIGRTYASKK